MSVPTPGDTVRSQWDLFAMLPEAVLFAGLNPRAVVLFAALMRYARDEASCAPSRGTLAKRLGWSTGSVDRAVLELVSAGFLTVSRKGGKPGEPWSPSTYTLVRPRTGPVSPTGEGWSAGGTSPISRVVTEGQDNQKDPRDEDQPPPPPAAASVATASEPPGFAEWYAAYPRHVERRAAVLAYVRARRRGAEQELLDGATRYAQDPTRDPAYTKHPATWLNADCWQDEGPARPQSTALQVNVSGLNVRGQLAPADRRILEGMDVAARLRAREQA